MVPKPQRGLEPLITDHYSFKLIHSNSYKLPPYPYAEVEAINQGTRFVLEITKPTKINLSLYGDLRHHEIYCKGDHRASLHAISNRLSQIVIICTRNISQLDLTYKYSRLLSYVIPKTPLLL